MTDLDREIARMKGWREVQLNDRLHPVYAEIHKPKDIGDEVGATMRTREECNWSTSDAKAFELVDEVCASGLHYFSMFLSCEGDTREWSADLFSYWPWLCSFTRQTRKDDRGSIIAKGFGNSRPEAICRAYIEAKKWMTRNKL